MRFSLRVLEATMVLVIAGVGERAFGCQCDSIAKTAVEAVMKSSKVFLAKVETRVDDPAFKVATYHVRPIRIWKGYASEIIPLQTLLGKQCGKHLEIGKNYLFYLDKSQPNQISTCNRTREERDAAADLMVLGPSLCKLNLENAFKIARVAATQYFKRDFGAYPATHLLVNCDQTKASISFRSMPTHSVALVHGRDGIDAEVRLNPMTGEAEKVMLGP